MVSGSSPYRNFPKKSFKEIPPRNPHTSSLIQNINVAKEHSRPKVLAAEIKGSWVPLGGYFTQENVGAASVLSYGDPEAAPIEFSIKRKFLHTSQSFTGRMRGGFAGFLGSTVSFGPFIYEHKLKLKRGRRVEGGFFSCDIFDNDVRAILHVDLGKDFGCFPVRLFLLPYDRRTGRVVAKASPVKPKTTTDAQPPPQGSPLGFFAGTSHGLEPLWRHVFSEFSTNRSVASYGAGVAFPTEVTLQDDYAVAKDSPRTGHVAFQEGGFFFGDLASRTKLLLDANMRLRNLDFYSCLSTSNLRVITTSDQYEHCFKVNVYLLPYDQATGSPKRVLLPVVS